METVRATGSASRGVENGAAAGQALAPVVRRRSTAGVSGASTVTGAGVCCGAAAGAWAESAAVSTARPSMPEPEGRGVRVKTPRSAAAASSSDHVRIGALPLRRRARARPVRAGRARAVGRREVLHAADLAEELRAVALEERVLELGPAGLAVGLAQLSPPSLAEAVAGELAAEAAEVRVREVLREHRARRELVVHEEGQAVVRPAADLRRHRGY